MVRNLLLITETNLFMISLYTLVFVPAWFFNLNARERKELFIYLILFIGSNNVPSQASFCQSEQAKLLKSPLVR